MKRRPTKLNYSSRSPSQSRTQASPDSILRTEQLEERIVMDAYTGVEGFYGNVTVTAKGDDAKWVGPNSMSVPSTYTTTSPVEISWLDIGAPDGASVTRFQPSGDSHLGATMTRPMGCLRLKTAKGSSGIPLERKPSTMPSSKRLLLHKILSSQHRCRCRPALNDRIQNELHSSNNRSVQFLHQPFWGWRHQNRELLCPVEQSQRPNQADNSTNRWFVKFLRSQLRPQRIWRSSHFLKVEWDGPGMPRQSFVPNGDIVYRHNFGFGRSEPELKGFISPQAYFSADKRLRDNNFALRYKTTFTIPTTGEYTFYLASDDRAELKLGNDSVIRKEVADASAKRDVYRWDNPESRAELLAYHQCSFA